MPKSNVRKKPVSSKPQPRRKPPTPTAPGVVTVDVRRLGRWAFTWFAALLVALVHVSALIAVSRYVAGDLPMYATMALPALVLLVVRPKETLCRGYRWLAVWALALTSYVATPVLLVGEAWVFRQTWLESGQTLRRPSWWPRGTRTKRSIKARPQT